MAEGKLKHDFQEWLIEIAFKFGIRKDLKELEAEGIFLSMK